MPIPATPKSDNSPLHRKRLFRWLRGGSMQYRRRIGRRYLLAYGYTALVATCALSALFVKRYLGGTLHGSTALRYAVGLAVVFAISVFLIFAAKSE